MPKAISPYFSLHLYFYANWLELSQRALASYKAGQPLCEYKVLSDAAIVDLERSSRFLDLSFYPVPQLPERATSLVEVA